MTDDYTQRANQYGLASKEIIQQVLKEPDTVVLDVRREDEIVVDGHFDTTATWTHTSCTPAACPLLEKAPELLLPDKNAPVIVHCKSGRRAAKAEQVLKSKGYTNVYNAGGLGDMPTTKTTAIDKKVEETSGCAVM